MYAINTWCSPAVLPIEAKDDSLTKKTEKVSACYSTIYFILNNNNKIGNMNLVKSVDKLLIDWKQYVTFIKITSKWFYFRNFVNQQKLPNSSLVNPSPHLRINHAQCNLASVIERENKFFYIKIDSTFELSHFFF